MKLIEALKNKRSLKWGVAAAIAVAIVFPLIQTNFFQNSFELWFLTLIKNPLNFSLYVIFSLLFGSIVSLQVYNLSKPKLDEKEDILERFKKSVPNQKVIKKSPLQFKKYSENPIIYPNKRNSWESSQTFNPAAVLLNKKIHLLYRAIGQDGISRLGYANSKKGLKIDKRHPLPLYEHPFGQKSPMKFNFYSYSSGGSWGGCEDPRLINMREDDRIYMTYTACDNGLRVGLTSMNVRDFLKGKWKWEKPKLISKLGEVHKNWVIFPEKIKGKYAILHSINPKISIAYRDSLDFKEGEYIESKYGGGKTKKGDWDNWIRGVGPPPLKTKEGWLVFYHAMDENDPGKYKVGALLLDLKNPEKIICKAKKPILEPEEHYENIGFKSGVVYASGAIIKKGVLFIYYGGADSHVCVAYNDLQNFLYKLKKGVKPKLKKKILKRKEGKKK